MTYLPCVPNSISHMHPSFALHLRRLCWQCAKVPGSLQPGGTWIPANGPLMGSCRARACRHILRCILTSRDAARCIHHTELWYDGYRLVGFSFALRSYGVTVLTVCKGNRNCGLTLFVAKAKDIGWVSYSMCISTSEYPLFSSESDI